MNFDGIVLAGGRSSRLDGVPKAELLLDGRTLVQRTTDALAAARRVVVVGGPAVDGAVAVRENPEFGGPAAGIAAGLGLVESPHVIVLACDMPRAAAVVELLLTATPSTDGVLLVDAGGREQYLAGLYRTDALRASVARWGGDLAGVSMRRLLEGLDLGTVSANDLTHDIDTWDDAASFGIERPATEVSLD